MTKRIAFGVAGALLAALFPVWLLARNWPSVQDLVAMNSVIGLFLWGLAWVALLGGASLLARAFTRTTEQANEEPSES